MKRIQKVILISTVTLLLTGLSVFYFRVRQTAPVKQESTVNRPIITVFIHGTFHLPSLPKSFIKFVHNCIDTFVFAKKGLYKANSLEEHYEHTWTKKVHHYNIVKTIADAGPERFPFDSCYVFGWSGELHPQKRLSAARKLHTSLTHLITEYKERYMVEPYVQIITHSHGGNVALNLAKINDTAENHIHIDELILLACPVQYETSHFVHHNTFKKIYSLHSHWDLVQVIDAQGWTPFKERVKNMFKKDTEKVASEEDSATKKCFFSERHFEADPKLVQVNIHFGIRGMFHVEFISERFMQQLPALLNTIDTQTILEANNECRYVDLNPMIKQARRLRLASKKASRLYQTTQS